MNLLADKGVANWEIVAPRDLLRPSFRRDGAQVSTTLVLVGLQLSAVVKSTGDVVEVVVRTERWSRCV